MLEFPEFVEKTVVPKHNLLENWNDGMLEYWNSGYQNRKQQNFCSSSYPIIPLFQLGCFSWGKAPEFPHDQQVLKYFLYLYLIYPTKISRRSITLVLVGPVVRRSPSFWKKW